MYECLNKLFPWRGMGWDGVCGGGGWEGGRARLEMQYGGEGVRIEWGFMLMVDSGQGSLLGMSECLMAKRMLFWCLYISSSFSLQCGIILCGERGIDAGFMLSYHHSELEKKRRLPPARACSGGRTRIRLDIPHAYAIKNKNIQHISKYLE